MRKMDRGFWYPPPCTVSPHQHPHQVVCLLYLGDPHGPVRTTRGPPSTLGSPGLWFILWVWKREVAHLLSWCPVVVPLPSLPIRVHLLVLPVPSSSPGLPAAPVPLCVGTSFPATPVEPRPRGIFGRCPPMLSVSFLTSLERGPCLHDTSHFQHGRSDDSPQLT